ncbi:MAG: nucleotide-binding protein [Phycisphaerales bacterium]
MNAERAPLARAERDDQATRLRRILGDQSAHRAHSVMPSGGVRPATIVLASGKGGVGKSVLALSVAAMIAKRRAVTLVDADFGAANLDVMLGVAPLRRLDEAFEMGFAPGHRPCDLAIDVAPRLRLVPGVIGSAYRPDARRRCAMLRSLDDFAGLSDTVVVDAAAGVDRSVTELLAVADCSLIVTTPEPTAMADAYALLKSLAQEAGPEPAGRAMVCVNMVRDARPAERVYRRIAAVADRFLGFRPALAGFVPFDRRVREGVALQQPAALRGLRGGLARSVASVSASVLESAEAAQVLRVSAR